MKNYKYNSYLTPATNTVAKSSFPTENQGPRCTKFRTIEYGTEDKGARNSIIRKQLNINPRSEEHEIQK